MLSLTEIVPVIDTKILRLGFRDLLPFFSHTIFPLYSSLIMPLKFDATLKFLFANNINDFLQFLHLSPASPSRLLNVDLSTISRSSDAVLGIGHPLELIIDLNFQSGPDPKLLHRLLHYNVLLWNQYDLPVRSIAILLRKKAEPKSLPQKLDSKIGGTTLLFEFEKVRLWDFPSNHFLEGSIGLLPFAVLAQLPRSIGKLKALQAIVHEVNYRLEREVEPNKAMTLMQATFNLASMRVNNHDLDTVFQGVSLMSRATAFDEMMENVYLARQEGRQEGLQEGRQEGLQEGLQKGLQKGFQEGREALQNLLLKLGSRMFGQPAPNHLQKINTFTELNQFETLIHRIDSASSWTELLN